MVAVALAYMVVFVAMYVLHPGSEDFRNAFFNLYELLPPFFAAGVLFHHSRVGRHAKKTTKIGWISLGLGCLSFALGETIWTFHELVLHHESPFPGVADIGYIASYPFLIMGVLFLVGEIDAAVGRARVIMDSAIVAASAGILTWTFLVEKLWSQSDVSLEGKILSAAYPLADIACLFVALVALMGASTTPSYRKVFGTLSIGIVLLTIADTVFTFQSLSDSYETGSWNDAGWAFGWILISFSCLMLRWARPVSEKASSRFHNKRYQQFASAARSFGPYAAVLFSIGVFYSENRSLNGESTKILLLVSLLMIRQIFTIMENTALTRRIRAMNGSLEEKVAERTRMLMGLQGLTKVINSTLDVQEVVQRGLVYSYNLMSASGVAIWLDPSGEEEVVKEAAFYAHGFESHDDVRTMLFDRDLPSQPEQFQIAKAGEVTRCCLVSPLLWQQKRVGLIAVVRDGEFFKGDEADFLESIAVEIGTSLMNGWLHADAVEKADRDSVTGLLNHRAIHGRLTRELCLAEGVGTEGGEELTIVLMDMNNFKLFNDTYGHVVGDEVLKTVGERLTMVTGERGYTARYGGDEFLLVLPRCTADEGESIAEAIQASLSGFDFHKIDDDRRIPITLSFGIATYPLDGRNRHDLLTVADRNLYHAKGTERGIRRTSENQRANRELRAQSSFETLDILVDSIDNKDRYTRKHSEDVTEYSLWIAEELGLSEDTMRTIRMAGLLHDVGKIGVPDEVLKKPGRLTDEEFEIMKRHPRIGELIVKAIPGMEGIVDGVRCHHERWDGKGYPDGLAEEAIPLLGRILAVADAFSAMTTDRPYRKGMDWSVALDQIRDNTGTQFDPRMAECFLKAVAKRQKTGEIELTKAA